MTRSPAGLKSLRRTQSGSKKQPNQQLQAGRNRPPRHQLSGRVKHPRLFPNGQSSQHWNQHGPSQQCLQHQNGPRNGSSRTILCPRLGIKGNWSQASNSDLHLGRYFKVEIKIKSTSILFTKPISQLFGEHVCHSLVVQQSRSVRLKWRSVTVQCASWFNAIMTSWKGKASPLDHNIESIKFSFHHRLH